MDDDNPVSAGYFLAVQGDFLREVCIFGNFAVGQERGESVSIQVMENDLMALPRELRNSHLRNGMVEALHIRMSQYDRNPHNPPSATLAPRGLRGSSAAAMCCVIGNPAPRKAFYWNWSCRASLI
jgi:hypothetical protein